MKDIIHYRGYEISKNDFPGYKVIKKATPGTNKPYDYFKFTATIESAINMIDRIENEKK